MTKRLQRSIPLLAITLISLGLSGTVMAASVIQRHRCGNGVLEFREQCDDGNRKSGDGCSSICRTERGKPAACAGHRIGENFLGPDGCNRCTCTANGMACTKMYCIPQSSQPSSRPTAPSGQACGGSTQCPANEYCTIDDGDCRSACPPNAEVCTQVCMGICRPSTCRPYVCPDGTRHPSCSEDGHVINYFADPCLTHRSSAASKPSERIY